MERKYDCQDIILLTNDYYILYQYSFDAMCNLDVLLQYISNNDIEDDVVEWAFLQMLQNTRDVNIFYRLLNIMFRYEIDSGVVSTSL